MPSKAYINFLHIRVDVLKLIETHNYYTLQNQKNLGYLTRSAIIMLCAAWERYNEDLLLESITYISNNINDINLLNKEIKKTISNKVRKDSYEIKPIELAGEGWKRVWLKYAEIETQLLNTPKSTKLDALFNTYLGIKYLNFWKVENLTIIDNFVSNRGDIAHNGNKASYVNMNKLRKYQDLIIENVIEIDSKMAIELRNMSGHVALPWVQDYYTDIKKYR